MIVSILYECSLYFLALLALPKMAYQMLVHKKYRDSLFQRLGIRFPVIDKGQRQLIWIHAVSVGETKAVALLAKRLKSELNNPIVVISSITETGHAEAKRSIPTADYHVYLPFDFRWSVKSIINRTRPDLVILCETDFWYNFLRFSKASGATIALVNGKVSPTSTKRFKRLSWLTKSLFNLIDLFGLQSRHYKERFLTIGIPEEKLIVTGNLKFDEQPEMMSETEKMQLKSRLGIQDGEKVVVIGSTHNPEEENLLEEIRKVWPAFPDLKVIIVPRHPERFSEVASLLKSKEIPFIRYSQTGSPTYNGGKVVLLDAMGMLRKCYQLADAAIVAGSYIEKVGGHNILEPLWYGVPLLYGPYMHSQPALVELVKEYGAGKQVSLQDMHRELISVLGGKDVPEMNQAGKKLISEVGGSTERTLNLLKQRLGVNK